MSKMGELAIKELNEGKTGRCHNCDCYFDMLESPDGGTTCSVKCSNEYSGYLETKEIMGVENEHNKKV